MIRNKGLPGIALLYLGSPESCDQTQGFVYRLFSDPEIFEFPGGRRLRPLFAGLVASLRASRVSQRYRILGGTSPLLSITRMQASALEAALRAKGSPAIVEVCMRYSRPFAQEAVARLVARGADEVIGFPLYPQFSKTTTGSSLGDLKGAVERISPGMTYREIPYWYEDPFYQTALVRRILACQNKMSNKEEAGLLFLAHSLPVRFVERGDPYIDQVQATVEGILQGLKRESNESLPWFLAYQGQVGPVKWVGPPVPRTLKTMVDLGIRRAIVVPVSFVSDHLETLYEIDLEYRRHALEIGMVQFERVASLNAREDFIAVLADIILHRCLDDGH